MKKDQKKPEVFCIKPKSLSLQHLGSIKCCNECPYTFPYKLFLDDWNWGCNIIKKYLGDGEDIKKGIPKFCPLKNEDEVNQFDR